MLCCDKSDKEVQAKHIRIYFQKFELNLIINILHAIMKVYILFVLHEEVYQHNKNKKENQWHLKCEKSDERPYLKQNYQLEFDWKSRILHLLMKNLLTTNRTVLILCLFLSPIPTTIHQIKPRQRDLNNNKVDSLIANEPQNGTPEIIMKDEVEIRNEEVKDEMEKDSCDDDKHGTVGKGIRITHLRELIHQRTKSEPHEDNENQNKVGKDRFERLDDRPHIDHLHEEIQKSHQRPQDQDEVNHRKNLHPQTLLLNYSNIFPQNLLRTRTRLAISAKILLIIVAQEHLDDLPPGNLISSEDLFFCLQIIEDNDGSITLIIE